MWLDKYVYEGGIWVPLIEWEDCFCWNWIIVWWACNNPSCWYWSDTSIQVSDITQEELDLIMQDHIDTIQEEAFLLNSWEVSSSIDSILENTPKLVEMSTLFGKKFTFSLNTPDWESDIQEDEAFLVFYYNWQKHTVDVKYEIAFEKDYSSSSEPKKIIGYIELIDNPIKDDEKTAKDIVYAILSNYKYNPFMAF